MDWKDALAALKGDEDNVKGSADTASDDAADQNPESKVSQKGKLHIALEKKGRGGKTATIIYGFEIPDEEIAEVARRLKQKLGIGGSSRGGEILLQGDVQAKVKELLKAEGFPI